MRNNIKSFVIALAVLFVAASCEDFENPIDGVPETDLFVQYAANTVDTVSTSEGGSNYTWTLQAPISAGEDLLATLSFTGDAVFGTDFTIVADNGLESSSATEAVVRIPFTPTGGDALIADQVDVTLSFPTDNVQDNERELIVTLSGAVGATNSSITYAGGRGPIRRDLVVNIGDIDCGFYRGDYDVTGTILVDDFGSGPFAFTEFVSSTNCPTGTVYELEDITGGLWGGPYATAYGSTAISAEVTIPEAGGAVTWTGVSDQFGGELIEDAASATASNYNATTGVVTIYWTATAYGERGITTFTPQ